MRTAPGARSTRSNFADAIYVLHFFQKKSKKGIATPQHHIDLIKRRLREAREAAKRGH
jgi:phage-related protein